MKPLKVKGRLWLIVDSSGKPIENIDTDMIFHNSHLAITETSEMGQHAFGNLDGWKDFPKKCRPGDLVIAGANFGAGSSRQQAVDCFAALGVAAIVAESFGAIYKRNAINSGMALVEAPGIFNSPLQTGDMIEVDFVTGEVAAKRGRFAAKPMSEVAREIYLAGNLFAFGRNTVEQKG